MKTHDEKPVNLSEDPKTGNLAVIGIVGAVLVFVAVVWLQALFHQVEERETRRKLLARPPAEIARLRAEQQEALRSYGWADQAAGIATIPIDRAMELVAREEAARAGAGTRASARGGEGARP